MIREVAASLCQNKKRQPCADSVAVFRPFGGYFAFFNRKRPTFPLPSHSGHVTKPLPPHALHFKPPPYWEPSPEQELQIDLPVPSHGLHFMDCSPPVLDLVFPFILAKSRKICNVQKFRQFNMRSRMGGHSAGFGRHSPFFTGFGACFHSLFLPDWMYGSAGMVPAFATMCTGIEKSLCAEEKTA